MKKYLLLVTFIFLAVVFFYPKPVKNSCIGFRKRKISTGPLYIDERGTALEARFEYICFGLTFKKPNPICGTPLLQEIRKSENTTEYNIPNTSLRISIPSKYRENNDRTAGPQADITPVINLQNIDNKQERISIYVEQTDLSSTQWLVENVQFQGQAFDPLYVNIEFKTLANREISITHTSCCGGYTPTYIFNTKSKNNENTLVIYTTNAESQAKENRDEGNYLLDDLVSNTAEEQL